MSRASSASTAARERLPPSLGERIRQHRVLVCCGAGGVGKTTTAASLALAAARLGRRVLVLTIDPSKRLAETLGVVRNPPHPVPLPPRLQAAAGITGPGRLDAWMLDPRRVADEAVLRFAGSAERARPILENRIYQQASAMVAGMHEYTAMKALHRFLSEEQYDLVVLDTPPARNALDFLDAPRRLSSFLDGSIFRLFLPRETGLVGRAASRLVARVLEAVFGEDFARELTTFLGDFGRLFVSLNGDLAQVRERLAQEDVSFLLVTTPSPAALTEAHLFHDRIRELRLPFGGFILNRSRARPDAREFPTPGVLPPDAPPVLERALQKLQWLARGEQLQVTRDRGLLADLALRGGHDAFAVAMPDLPGGGSALGTLVALADLAAAERRTGPR